MINLDLPYLIIFDNNKTLDVQLNIKVYLFSAFALGRLSYWMETKIEDSWPNATQF